MIHPEGSKPIRTVENDSKLSFLNLCWSPDASIVAIGDSKDRLQFYDSSTGKKLAEHVEFSRSPNASEVSPLAFFWLILNDTSGEGSGSDENG
jgi:hypothetical protein